MDGGQLLAAGAARDQLSITFRGDEPDAAGTQGIGSPGKIEDAEAEGQDKDHNGHGGSRKGGDAQFLRQGDAQHGGGAGGDNIQDHGAVQENSRHQELGYVGLAEHGDRNGIDGKNDDKGVDAAVCQQESDDQGARNRRLHTQKTKQEVGDRFGGTALLHQFAVSGADGEEEQIRTKGASQRSGVRAGQRSPEGEAAGNDNDDGADQGGDKAVQSLEGQINEDCNTNDHADNTDYLHIFSSLSFTAIWGA